MSTTTFEAVCCSEGYLNVLFAASAAGLFPVRTFCVRRERHSSPNNRERATCEGRGVAHTFGKFVHHKSSKRTRSPGRGIRYHSSACCTLCFFLFFLGKILGANRRSLALTLRAFRRLLEVLYPTSDVQHACRVLRPLGVLPWQVHGGFNIQ